MKMLNDNDMRIEDFTNYIEQFEDNHVFSFGLSWPYSWRGSYDEVCFTVLHEPMTAKQIKERIKKALVGTYIGYKGGEYSYHEYTPVNFEEGEGRYSDEEYCRYIIQKVTGEPFPTDIQSYMVQSVFK